MQIEFSFMSELKSVEELMLELVAEETLKQTRNFWLAFAQDGC